jgi:hypothetical protein
VFDLQRIVVICLITIFSALFGYLTKAITFAPFKNFLLKKSAMKKLFAILAVGTVLVACNNAAETASNAADSAAAKVDSAATAVVDSAKAKVDSTAKAAVDTLKAKVDSLKKK